ncbi:hypothetical protein AWR38_06175 [Idiomarina sp. WRN-38]|nr:hypothetical protein AUR68_06160 [Idiomarina sp. H105]OAE91003.1 hypothetical protein AWR38_06175 [Idiomarina sp. WRN-38]
MSTNELIRPAFTPQISYLIAGQLPVLWFIIVFPLTNKEAAMRKPTSNAEVLAFIVIAICALASIA